MVKKAHFFKFIEGLKLHESRKTDHLYNLLCGTTPNERFSRSKPRDQERDHKIKFYTNLLSEGEISIKDFLRAMATDENCTLKVYTNVNSCFL